MRAPMITALATMLLTGLVTAQEQEKAVKKFELTAAIQVQLDSWKLTATKWAADPIVMQAVAEQNVKGPLADMDEKKWKNLRRRSDEVKAFQDSAAGKLLAAKTASTNGLVSEAFLSAQKGEKVAFVEKTSSYIHLGKPKFDVPLQKLEPWQGKPEFDESTQTYAIQLSVPVVQGVGEQRRAIGVLVIGLNLTQLVAPKPPVPGK